LTAAIVVRRALPPFMLKLIETSTFGQREPPDRLNYEFADFTYKSDARRR
jgi:hypothetical protein